jgi:signal transduction histidine kinase
MQVARQAGMGIVEVPQRIHRDDAHPMAEAWRIGEAVYIHSRESIVTNYPRLRSLAEGSIYEAWAAVPMFRERRLIAIMGMSYGEPRRFDEEERSMIMALAEVATQAIDRAQLFEMERRTRAEAEAALSAQDEFLSIASHELRTPVAAVKATAQLAQRAIARGGLEPARLQRHLESISRAADRLTGLVDDLLDVSRLRTGRLQLRRQLVDLSPLLEEIIERYRAQAPEVGGHVFRLTIPREPIQIDADPSRLEQVLDNFLSNAVKYSPTGGEIRVMADPDQGGVSITVTDSGIGLPHGQEERIFEPFGRASNAAIQQIPGLGLGLSICRELVEAHGGRIWASSPGEHRGTTVGMWLPLRGPAPTTEDGAIDP